MRNPIRLGLTALIIAATTAILPSFRSVGLGQTNHIKIGGTLNLLAWEGYADPSFVKPFERQTGCQVSATYAGSSNEMFAKFHEGGGTVYDLVSASGDASLRFVHARLVAPVNLSKIPNWKNLAPQLKSPPHNTVNGKHYGVSFMWGPDPLIYSKKVFKKAPTTWRVLYEKKYKGKITIPDNPIQIAEVAVMLHYKHPYDLKSKQLAKIKSVLMAQRPLLRAYWESAGDFTNMFKNCEAVVGAGWPLMTVQLRQAGFPVGETIPREGATGWADTWMLSTRSRHVACAYAWMNYVISPRVQAKVVKVTDYSPANLKTAKILGPKVSKELHITDVKYFNSLKFWQTPPNFSTWVSIWDQVKG